MLFRAFASVGESIRKRFVPERIRQPLYRGSAADDLLFGQPVNVALRILRRFCARSGTREGATVLIVNYRTPDLLPTVVRAVRNFSGPDVEIMVLDNASRDGSWEWLRTQPFGIRPVRLPVNIGHGRALDVGLFLARTSVVITLDSDAFPYSSSWLSELLGPLASAEVAASGSHGRRDRLHPVCAAYRRTDLLALGLSFHNYNLHKDLGQSPVFGENTWDTGELISDALGERKRLLQSWPASHGYGMVIADVVYHHTAMTTALADDRLEAAADKQQTWRQAVEAMLGADWLTSGA